jgi:hypothetical protein
MKNTAYQRSTTCGQLAEGVESLEQSKAVIFVFAGTSTFSFFHAGHFAFEVGGGFENHRYGRLPCGIFQPLLCLLPDMVEADLCFLGFAHIQSPQSLVNC